MHPHVAAPGVCESFLPVHTKTLRRRKYDRIPYGICFMLEAHVNEKLVFSKFFTEQSLFLKKYVFGDHFHLIRVEGIGQTTRKKKYPYSNHHGYVWTGPNLQTRPLCHPARQVRITQITVVLKLQKRAQSALE